MGWKKVHLGPNTFSVFGGGEREGELTYLVGLPSCYLHDPTAPISPRTFNEHWVMAYIPYWRGHSLHPSLRAGLRASSSFPPSPQPPPSRGQASFRNSPPLPCHPPHWAPLPPLPPPTLHRLTAMLTTWSAT